MVIQFTYVIIAITCLVSISAFSRPDIVNKLIFNASSTYHRKEYYRLFSAGLLHGDWGHLIVNMYVLYAFGQITEAYYSAFIPGGQFSFLLMYILSLGASTLYSMYRHKDNHYYNALGASGATSAVVFGMILFNPMAPLRFIFIPFVFPAVLFGIAYLIYSHYASKKKQDNVGHDAHFWGAIFGFIFPIVIQPKLFIIFINQVIDYVAGYIS